MQKKEPSNKPRSSSALFQHLILEDVVDHAQERNITDTERAVASYKVFLGKFLTMSISRELESKRFMERLKSKLEKK